MGANSSDADKLDGLGRGRGRGSSLLIKQNPNDAGSVVWGDFYFDSTTTSYVISDNTGATFSGTSDTWLREQAPTSNFGGNGSFFVSAWTTGDRETALIKFDGWASEPTGTITSAKLRIYWVAAANTGTIEAYALLRAFNETQATWNEASTGTNWTTGGGLDTTNDRSPTLLGSVSVPSSGQYYEISGAALNAYIQSIVNGGADLGILLADAGVLAPAGLFRATEFGSSEGTDGQRPELTFDWVAAAGGGSTSVTGKSGVAGLTTATKQSNTTATGKHGVVSTSNSTKKTTTAADSELGIAGSTNATKKTTTTGTSKVGLSGSTTATAGGFNGSTSVAGTLGVKGSTSATKNASTSATGRHGVIGASASNKAASGAGTSKLGVRGSTQAIKSTSTIVVAKNGLNGSSTASKQAATTGTSKLGLSGATTFTSGNINKSTSVAGRLGLGGSTTARKSTIGSGVSKVGVKGSTSYTAGNAETLLTGTFKFKPSPRIRNVVAASYARQEYIDDEIEIVKPKIAYEPIKEFSFKAEPFVSEFFTKLKDSKPLFEETMQKIIKNGEAIKAKEAQKQLEIAQKQQDEEDEAVLMLMFDMF